MTNQERCKRILDKTEAIHNMAREIAPTCPAAAARIADHAELIHRDTNTALNKQAATSQEARA